MTWRHAFYSFLDHVYPIVEPLSTEGQERRQRRLREQKEAIPDSDDLLEHYVTASQYLLDKENDRKQGIEARLTSILGLSSIAATVAFGGFFLGSSGISHIGAVWLRCAITIVGLYLVLEICAASLAAVRGLSTRPYCNLDHSDLVPSRGESRTVFLHRKAERTLEVLIDHETQNNDKLTQLKIAHCTMRNFARGLLVFAVVAAIAANKVGSSDELIDKLKANHDLNELLRGPQGPAGMAGPKGDPASVPCSPKNPGKKRCPHGDCR